jgi:NADH-quinone oxidoreductase subunit J
MVLFLFVIMFLGVDRREALVETIRVQRPLAIGLGLLLIAEVVLAVRAGVGLSGTPGPFPGGSTEAVARRLFTHYVFPFEATSILLIVAAVAAMVLARRATGGAEGDGEVTEGGRPVPSPRERVS